MAHESWGRWIRSTPARVIYEPRFDDLVLPYGLGRSYGDVCLNNGHTLLDTRRMNHLLAFDETTGVLRCEGGATLDDILSVIVPRGWFLPVTPGTKYVTIGGCIANDVHGKNHHRAGTFGRHVLSFDLLRSDGSRIHCTPSHEFFAPTIGGLGLTGLILSAEIQLRKIDSPAIAEERIPFRSLAAFERLSASSDATHDYTVAWLDPFTNRGLFIRGNHSAADVQSRRGSRNLPMRVAAPFLTRATMRAFNTAYFIGTARADAKDVHYEPFFYPLDAIANWNSVYGKRGFLQYQFVIPEERGFAPVVAILKQLERVGSFLTVIKKFGALQSPGMLSFPRVGTTVSMDFGASDELLPLLDRCDALVEAAGGSVYPAKDARMSPERFRRFFPRWEEFRRFADPHFSSSFHRRITT